MLFMPPLLTYESRKRLMDALASRSLSELERRTNPRNLVTAGDPRDVQEMSLISPSLRSSWPKAELPVGVSFCPNDPAHVCSDRIMETG